MTEEIKEHFRKLSEYYKNKKEKPGEWIPDKEHSIVFDLYRCSKCGNLGAKHFKYCPSCGAIMKRGAE